MKKKTFDDILCISMSEGSLAQGDLGPCDVHLNKLEQGGTYVLSRLSFSFLFFFLGLLHCCCVYCLLCDFSIVATCSSIPMLCFFVCFIYFDFVVFCLVNQSRNKGEG